MGCILTWNRWSVNSGFGLPGSCLANCQHQRTITSFCLSLMIPPPLVCKTSGWTCHDVTAQATQLCSYLHIAWDSSHPGFSGSCDRLPLICHTGMWFNVYASEFLSILLLFVELTIVTVGWLKYKGVSLITDVIPLSLNTWTGWYRQDNRFFNLEMRT